MSEATIRQRVISKLKSPLFLIGIGTLILTIVIFFAQGGFHNMNPWYIVFLVISIGLIIYGLVKSNDTVSILKTRPEEAIEQDLIDTLTAMHKRLMELQKEKAENTKVSIEVFKTVLRTLADRMGVVKSEDWSRFESDIKSRILRAIPPKPYMSIRGRFNFRKWAKLNEQWKESAYFSALSIAMKARDELFNTRRWTLADGMKIAEWADGYGWGIKELRDDDLQWKGLYESIDKRLLIDNILGGLIKEHIDLSHVYNNINLVIHFSDKFKDDIYSLILYEALVGSPMSPEQVDIGLNEILGKIEKRLKEMDNVKTSTVYCCVRDNVYQVWAINQGNYKDTLFVTLGTSSRIIDIKALMGATLPTIIEGGENGNFITFKISELPPSVSLGYLVNVISNAEKPRKFTAWSETMTSNIAARFIGECPKITGFGPEETAPP